MGKICHFPFFFSPNTRMNTIWKKELGYLVKYQDGSKIPRSLCRNLLMTLEAQWPPTRWGPVCQNKICS